jgi:hypothetical protein
MINFLIIMQILRKKVLKDKYFYQLNYKNNKIFVIYGI